MGLNEITVTVSAQDGTTKSYTAAVSRAAPSSDADLKTLSLTGIDFGAFDPATLAYSTSAPHDTFVTTVSAIAAHPDATVSFEDSDADPGTPGHQQRLDVGSSTVSISVLAQDGATSKLYEVAVQRAASTVQLDSLELSAVDFGSFQSAGRDYRAEVDHAVDTTTVAASASDGAATVTFSHSDADSTQSGHQIALDEGHNRIVVTVTDTSSNVGVYTVTVHRDVLVHIPDDDLRAEVLSELGKQADSPIYGTDMELLTLVNLNGRNVASLEGLQHAVNLRTLYAGYNSISDLGPLLSLPQLELLWINDNPIADLAPLAQLTSLSNLHLQGFDQTDLAFLAELDNLSTLYLGYEHIPDLWPISVLTGLNSLWVNIAGVSDLSALATLTELNLLDLRANAIQDLSALAGMSALANLDLRGNAIQDLSALAGMSALANLDLRDNTIQDLSALAGMSALANLDLRYNRVTDLAHLVANPALSNGTQIDVRSNPLSPAAISSQIPDLQARGAQVLFDVGLITAESEPQIYNDNLYVVPMASALTDTNSSNRFSALRQELKEFYRYFEDNFDFIVVLRNLDRFESSFGYAGISLSASSDVLGIGIDPFQNGGVWGSYGKLLSVVELVEYDGIKNGPMLHELVHQWGVDIIDGPGGHWGFSSADGLLGGFDAAELTDLGDGRYTAGDFPTMGWAQSIRPYSPIELYLAGLIAPDDVPDLLVAQNADWVRDENGGVSTSEAGDPIFAASEILTLTVEDIIEEHGPRVPSHADSQKAFRAAVLLLIDDTHPGTRERLDTASDLASWFSHPGNDSDDGTYNFYEATGGRATLEMGGLSEQLREVPRPSDTPVHYRVRFTGTWTTDSLASGVSVPSAAHFTTLVGAAHNSGVTFWELNDSAGAAIENMAEDASAAAFKSEADAAIAASAARGRFSLANTGPTATNHRFFDVSEAFPLVTLVSKVHPSPDWFVGVSGLSLREGDEWATRKEIELYPYDAGTEDGTEFSSSGNSDTIPQGVITSIRNTGKFSDEPLAKLVFERWEPVLSVADAGAEEGDTVDFTVTLDRRGITPAQQVTVQYATSDGTATGGSDYTAANGTLTFSTAETTKTVSVQTASDSATEGDEDLTLTLSNPANALLLAAEATATIKDTTNSPPHFGADTTRRVDENTPANTGFDTAVTATDPDDDTLTYTLGGTDADSFTIDGASGQLRTKDPLNYEDRSSFDVTVTAADPEGATDSVDVTILVDNLDEAGTVTLTAQTLVRTPVTASLEDPDGNVRGVSWSWQRSVDLSTWSTIGGAASGTYTPQTADVGHYLRAAASYRDGQGSGKSARATTASMVPNRAPEFKEPQAVLSVDENTATNTDFDTPVSATDPDGHDLDYTLRGAGAASFDIDGSTGQLHTKAALNYEHRRSYSLRVTAADEEGATDSIEVTVNIGNMDEDGTVTLSSGTPAAGTGLTAELTDPDGGITATTWVWRSSPDQNDWTLITGAGTATYTPRDGAPPDGDVGLYLRATASYRDGEGSGKSAKAVSANKVQAEPVPNRPPQFVSATDERRVDENTATGIEFDAPVTATDPDGDTRAYTLGGTHRASFDIDGSTGRLRTRAALNHESRQSYSVTVTARDPKGAEDSVDVTIHVNNRDEPGTVTLSATIPTVGNALEATLSGDPDGGVTGTTWSWQRSSNGTSWATIVAQAPPTYTPQTADIGRYLRAVASYDDAQGTGKSAQASWPDRVPGAENQAPDFGAATAQRSVAENSPPATPVGNPLTATDPDGDPDGDDLTYSLTHITSDPFFEIDAGTGQISVADSAQLDYESKRSHTVEVAVTDGKDPTGRPDNAADDTIKLTIHVTDIDDTDTARPVTPGTDGGGGPVEESPAQPDASEVFDDVARGAYFEPAVTWMIANNVTAGCANGLFCPDDDVTRAQFVTLLWRAAGRPAPQQHGSEIFNDTDAGSYADQAIGWAAQTGITTGCNSTTGDEPLRFCPNGAITRAQASTMLHRMVGSPPSTHPADFDDIAPDAYYATAVAWMQQHAITSGCTADTFCPHAVSTRAHAAAFIHRTATTPQSWAPQTTPFATNAP